MPGISWWERLSHGEPGVWLLGSSAPPRGPEEEVGSLERVCARFAPNFGPGAGHQQEGSYAFRMRTRRPGVKFRDSLRRPSLPRQPPKRVVGGTEKAGPY